VTAVEKPAGPEGIGAGPMRKDPMNKTVPDDIARPLESILHHFWWSECDRLLRLAKETEVAWEGEVEMLAHLATVRAWFDRTGEGEDGG